MKLFINKKGVTLVELIIATGIIAIVLSALYGFNIFYIKTYSMGKSQWNLQSDVRIISNLITRELRYATEVELSNQIPTLGDGYSYIRTEDNSIKFYKDGKLSSTFPSVPSANIKYEVDFTGSIDNLLAFKIIAHDNSKGKSYSTDSKVLCMNIIDGESIKNTSGVINSIIFK